MNRRDRIRAAARRLNQSSVTRGIARAGLGVEALVHLAIAAAAVTLAVGAPSHADLRSIFGQVASWPGGVPLLIAAGIALFGLAFWQWTDAAWVSAHRTRTVIGRRVADAGKALGFAGAGVLCLAIALGYRSRGSLADASERLLAHPVGVIALLGAAVVIGVLAVAHIVSVFGPRGRLEVDPPVGWPTVVVRILGVVGHLGKAVAFATVALFLLAAVVLTRPSLSGGLDTALHRIVQLPLGNVVMVVLAIGLAAYGVYLGIRAVFLRTANEPGGRT